MNRCKKWREKIYLYCYDELLRQEKRGLEEHIAGCKDCTEQLQKTKGILALVSKKPLPQQSPQFWSNYNISLQERLKKKEFSVFAVFSSIRERWEGMRFYLLPTFNLRLAGVVGTVVVMLIIGTLGFIGFQLIRQRPIVSLPTQIAREVHQEIPSSPPAEVGRVFISPELEDELILQDLALLAELGEDIDIPLTEEDLIKDMEMLAEISST